MRPPQHTLNACEVQHLAEELLSPVLGTWPENVRKCTLTAVIAVLCYAAARICSIEDACQRLKGAPNADTVLKRLAAQLVDQQTLDQRVRRTIQATLPRALRRGCWDVAMDLTLIPYHGQPQTDDSEIYRSQAKSGTTHFHAYATAFVIRDGLRFTVAIMPVAAKTPNDEVVKELRRRVVAAGLKIRRLLLDRGFNTAGVVRYLQSARQPFIMPQTIRGKLPKSGELRGLRLIRAKHPTGWTSYVWKPVGENRVSVDLCVVRRRRADREGNRAFLYACWGVRCTPRTLCRLYRTRFGIETSYRQMNEVRAKTCTRNPTLRFLFVAVALLLRNLWAWLHWTTLAQPHRGRRRLHLELLRLRTMVLWLLHLAEQLYQYVDQTLAYHPPDEPLMARRPRST